MPAHANLLRKAAKERGAKTYTDLACKKCGSKQKYVSCYACVPCTLKRTTEKNKTPESKAHQKIYKRMKKFGITEAIYNEMLTTQGNKCAICRSSKTGNNRGWNVDHCHTTGKIRGLLCALCNIGLGRFKDSPEIMEKAIEYLRFHRLK